MHLITGGEDGRPGWPSADPSRKRNSGPITGSVNLSKQKGPIATDLPVSKDATVSNFYMHVHKRSCQYLLLLQILGLDIICLQLHYA